MSHPVKKIDRFQYSISRLAQHILRFRIKNEKLHQRFLESYKENGKGKVVELPRVDGRDTKHLYEEYVKKGKPVVITGVASNWDCVKKWTPEYFKSTYGDDQILISDNLANTETSDYFNVAHATLREIIECMERGDNSKYARFNNLLYLHPELIDDVDADWLVKMTKKSDKRSMYQVFIGAKGTKTSLHCACAHNFFTQVYGVKKWRIIAASEDPALKPIVNGSPFFVSTFDPENPTYNDHPAAEYVDVYETDLKAGEILFVPASYWHHVVNETDSIGVGLRWTDLGAFKLNFTQVMMVLTASNPSALYVLKNRKNYSKIFQYISETKAKKMEKASKD